MTHDAPLHVTINDVAGHAGVSVATAARALGGYGSVSASSRERVLTAAASLGYTPNMVARSMITRSTRTLGVIVADIENQFFQRALRGITDVTTRHGYDVILANTDESLEQEKRALEVMTGRRVDGIILSPVEVEDTAAIKAVATSGVPIVLIDRRLRGVSVDSVGVKNRTAAYEATEHLIGLGHERIAVVTGGSSAVADQLKVGALERLLRMSATTLGTRTAGYRKALADNGVRHRPDYVAANGFHREDGLAAAQGFLALDEPPTAIIAFDSLLSLGVLQGLRQAAVRCPEDMSVIGFDDAPWAEVVQPPLTVISQPTREIGRQAAELLLERLQGSHTRAVHYRLPTRLVERGSVAPPRRAVRPTPSAG